MSTYASAEPPPSAASAPASSAPAAPPPEGMVWIAGATFDAIDGDHVTSRTTVTGFFVDRRKVTNAEYKGCFDAKQCSLSYDPQDILTASTGGYPAASRSQKEARAYCKFAGKRLPTAAEWQLTARGQEGRIYPWGNERPAPCRPWCEPVRNSTPEGVIGMAGTLWEYSDGVVCYTGGSHPNSREGCANLAAVIHGGTGTLERRLAPLDGGAQRLPRASEDDRLPLRQERRLKPIVTRARAAPLLR